MTAILLFTIGWVSFVVWFVSTLNGSPWLDEWGNEISANDRKHLMRHDIIYH